MKLSQHLRWLSKPELIIFFSNIIIVTSTIQ